MNRLYYGDNLDVLREHVPDGSVDLVYLDPPFNSNAGYNVLFKSASGADAEASIEAFDDTWTWGTASQDALLDIDHGTNRALQVVMRAMHDAIGENPLMAYLSMMAVRLVELHRVLKQTGSLYLHCDPTASHYLKVVMDAVFGAEQFLNEITWKRTGTHSSAKRWGPVHDTIFCYAKSEAWTWNRPYVPLDEEHRKRHYRFSDANGRRYAHGELTAPGTRNGRSGAVWKGFDVTAIGRHWMTTVEKLDAMLSEGRVHLPGDGSWPRLIRYEDEGAGGRAVGDVWSDIPPLNMMAKERLGYPTQKPRALLERIIAASSNPGDLVLDPFCGCGTAVDAAEKLERRWIGIDITHLAVGMIEDRMRFGYPGIRFETVGVPRDLASAEKLARDDPHQFQQWVCWQVGGFPRDKKGGDKGVDGWFNYEWVDPDRDNVRSVQAGVIGVKAGDNINPNMVRDLGRVMERDLHRFGLFVCKSLPTRGMEAEAASHPMIDTQWGRFPALQIVTLADIMLGRKPKLPPLVSPVKKAARVETRASHKAGAQGGLDI